MLITENKEKSSKINNDTVKAAYDYVRDYFIRELSPDFLFHSVKHTDEVLKQAESIGKSMGLNNDELNVLRVSAIFHDLGYTKTYEGHEKESAVLARQFLTKRNIKKEQIDEVINAILSTKVPQSPQSLVSEILCDADLTNLTFDNYFENAEKMRQEWIKTGRTNMSEKEFHINSVSFFENHQYHTDFARRSLEPKKRKNLRLIKERIDQL